MQIVILIYWIYILSKGLLLLLIDLFFLFLNENMLV